MFVSVRGVVVGSVVLVGGLVSILVLLPRVTPFFFLNCSLLGGGTQCSSSLNFIYPTAFLFSMAGAVVMFYGMFGRRFILGPLYVVGMLSLGLGSAGVAFGYLERQWCVYNTWGLCVGINLQVFAPAIVAGLILIGGNGFWWRRGLPKTPQQIPAKPR